MYALTNAVIYTGNDIIKGQALLIEGDKIKGVVAPDTLPKDVPTYDLQGATLSAGFIDLQVNGCGGVQFNDDLAALSEETLATMQQSNVVTGCTSFLPTLITSSPQLLKKALATLRSYLAQPKNQHQALGLHLEGPFINEKKKGTHNAHFIRPASQEDIDVLCQHRDVIKLVTVAPEKVVPSLITRLTQAGITVSAGHSAASYDEALAGYHAGITTNTHLFNAMMPLQGREPGLLGAIFNTPEVYAGVIADGYHVAWPNIRMAKQLKGEKLFLITDATAMANSDIETFIFAGKPIYQKEGRCVDENGVISGSALTMIQAVKNCVQQLGIPLYEAIRMATYYPAEVIHVLDHLGSIDAGKIANLTAFDENFTIKLTMVNGQVVYQHE